MSRHLIVFDTNSLLCSYGNEETPVADLRQLRYFQPKYVCVDGDGTVPAESAERPMVSSISVSDVEAEACATVTVHPQNEGKQHVELNALSVSVDA
ncbi:unnamed protein product [Prunus armeniaca]|uniref:Uncharacterized protein n=1 Tax=Prunus armeniaca TaxID=36596 RepID=A0A6J5X3F7_PRUAR|nr:unnamed protein product [Prunus armeniaca]